MTAKNTTNKNRPKKKTKLEPEPVEQMEPAPIICSFLSMKAYVVRTNQWVWHHQPCLEDGCAQYDPDEGRCMRTA